MTRIKRMLLSLLAVGLILALGAAPALASSVAAWINNSSATIYAATGKSGSLRAGTSVTVTAAKKGWAQIEYMGYTGYVRCKYLTAQEGITGYVKKSAYAYKSASTSSKRYGPLAVGTELKVVGIDGDFFQVTNGKAYGYIAKSAISRNKPSDAAIIASKVQLVSWSSGNKLFPKRSYAKIYDIQSGLIVNVYRMGGTNHAELEPATSEDTEKLLKMSGGKFSWSSRPVILYAGGKFIAAAINTMPHGGQTISDNGFNGQFCLHLQGSKTHGSNCENANHQAAIKAACKWAASKI